MKRFEEFVAEGKVIRRSQDPAEGASLLRQAKERLAGLQRLPLDETSASFRFESAYEALREALQAFLAKAGYKQYSHEAVIAFAAEKRLLPEGNIMTADRYREIRNDINYRGKKVTRSEAEEIIAFVTRVVPELARRFQTMLGGE